MFNQLRAIVSAWYISGIHRGWAGAR